MNRFAKIAPIVLLLVVLAVLAWRFANAPERSSETQPKQNPTQGQTEDKGHAILDARGKRVDVPAKIERVICSGSGCLRLLTYLQCQDRAVAVDDIEKRKRIFDARPYALANPQFRDLPLFGEFRGRDNPELILTLSPGPQVIFKTNPTAGHDPEELEAKTGIPVVGLEYGDLGRKREQFYQALRIMGKTLGRTERAEAVIAFFNAEIAELSRRTADIPEKKRPTTYVGGIAYRGPHGYQSTEPDYPPFTFVHARNVVAEDGGGEGPKSTRVSKEKLLEWDPQVLFLDLSTLQLGDKAGGLHELRTDPVYRSLTAVKEGRVYGVLPYNWYTRNYGSILADAWYAGKVLYPERFGDIDPAEKADSIYRFLVNKAVYKDMQQRFGSLAFRKIDLNPQP